MLSYQQEKNNIEGKKQIILNPSDSQKREFLGASFGENEVYGVDILISTGEGKVRCIYVIIKKNFLYLKIFRLFFNSSFFFYSL